MGTNPPPDPHFCKTCAWIASRPESEHEGWAEAMADWPRRRHMTVYLAMRRLGFDGSIDSVENHRKAGH